MLSKIQIFRYFLPSWSTKLIFYWRAISNNKFRVQYWLDWLDECLNWNSNEIKITALVFKINFIQMRISIIQVINMILYIVIYCYIPLYMYKTAYLYSKGYLIKTEYIWVSTTTSLLPWLPSPVLWGFSAVWARVSSVILIFGT